MRLHSPSPIFAVAVALQVAFALPAQASDVPAPRTACGQNTGPDVIVGNIDAIANYATSGDVDAFSLGTTCCNISTANVQSSGSTNRHPVITQHMYVYRVIQNSGRFEQIGVSWVTHQFTALVGDLCCTCNNLGGFLIGAGCSSPESAGFCGIQLSSTGGLGPRFDINAHTGSFSFPYPFRNSNGSTPVTSITRRLQIALGDLDPSMNPGAQYFAEAAWIAADDASARNQNNNYSYRPAIITGSTPNFAASLTGSTVRESPAILAWQTIDPNVVVTNIDTPELEDPPASGNTTGRLILAANATDLGDGRWHYEYALFNMNSDRAVASFAVPLAAPLSADEIGFHDIFYHSGDGYGSTPANQITFDGSDWPAIRSADALTWSLVPATPIENSNAIRWGTLYNFRFDADAPPATGEVTIGLFKAVPGLPDSITATTLTPCFPGDLNGDGAMTLDDIPPMVDALLRPAPAPCAADINRDGSADGADIEPLVATLLAR